MLACVFNDSVQHKKVTPVYTCHRGTSVKMGSPLTSAARIPCASNPTTMTAKSLLLIVSITFILSGSFYIPCAADQRPSLKVEDTRCEYRQNPLGIDSVRPRLSWSIQSTVRNCMPTAFQVQVADSRRSLTDEKNLVWDSGKVYSADPTHVTFGGPEMVSGQRLYWRVRVWGADNKASDWSKLAWWETAILRPAEWRAKWITCGRPLPTRDGDFYKDDPAPLFRKTFDLDKPVRKARLYIAGLGYYEASINGQRVSDTVLDPAWTTYSKRVLYSTYDVTSQVKSGHNCLGIMLGNGWYNPLPMRMWGQLNLREFMPVGRPCVIAQLAVEYTDGSQAFCTTDEDWKTSAGPILRNSVYLGEVYDARREIVGWNKPSYDDSSWQRVTVATAQLGDLHAQSQPPIKPAAVLSPICRTEPKPGVYIFDFGQNMAGWVRLKVKGPAGTRVTLRFGELLYANGTLNVMTTVCGQIKKAEMGGAGAPDVCQQMDTYILKGADGGRSIEEYMPRFTYHGFRYVEVTGYPGKPGMDAVQAVRLHTAVDTAGSFSCSNRLLNRIQAACRASFASNLMGVQTDCPGRERFAYGDDIACACEAHLFNYGMATFYAKTVRDFADAARPNGALTLLAPWTGHSIGGFDPGGGSFADVHRNGANAGSGPLSGVLAHSLLIQKAYQFYGDRRLVEEQYEVARNSLEFIRTHTKHPVIQVGLGDWSSVVPTETSILDTALYYQHARIVAQLARILDRNDDADRFEALAKQIKAAFVREFIEVDATNVGLTTQAALACGLYHGLVPTKRRPAIALLLVDDVMVKHHGHLTTGIFGTKYLLNALTAAHRPDVAYEVINQTTYPGWGYMLETGATTLWEVWEYSDDIYSHNHSMFGTVSAWFYTALGGIQPAADAIGFNKIVLKPSPVAGLEYADTSYRSVRGSIVSNWRIKDDMFCWNVLIPPSASAVIYIPREFAEHVQESGHDAERAVGVELIGFQDGVPTYRVQSGSYFFTSRRSHPQSQTSHSSGE